MAKVRFQVYKMNHWINKCSSIFFCLWHSCDAIRKFVHLWSRFDQNINQIWRKIYCPIINSSFIFFLYQIGIYITNKRQCDGTTHKSMLRENAVENLIQCINNKINKWKIGRTTSEKYQGSAINLNDFYLVLVHCIGCIILFFVGARKKKNQIYRFAFNIDTDMLREKNAM